MTIAMEMINKPLSVGINILNRFKPQVIDLERDKSMHASR